MCAVRTQRAVVELDLVEADVIAWRCIGFDQDEEVALYFEGNPGPFDQVRARIEVAQAAGRVLGALWFEAGHNVVVG